MPGPDARLRDDGSFWVDGGLPQGTSNALRIKRVEGIALGWLLRTARYHRHRGTRRWCRDGIIRPRRAGHRAGMPEGTELGGRVKGVVSSVVSGCDGADAKELGAQKMRSVESSNGSAGGSPRALGSTRRTRGLGRHRRRRRLDKGDHLIAEKSALCWGSALDMFCTGRPAQLQ